MPTQSNAAIAKTLTPVQDGTLTRRATLTFVSSLLQQGARFIVGFVVTPIIGWVRKQQKWVICLGATCAPDSQVYPGGAAAPLGRVDKYDRSFATPSVIAPVEEIT